MSDYVNPSAELRARVALQKYSFRNSHSLGQNFLLSEGLIAGILDSAEILSTDNVLEIGPGAGVMTRLLAGRAAKVLALELDRGLEPVLRDVLEGLENAKVVFEDALKADIAELARGYFGGEPYRVVANLPYYITADVLLKLTALPYPPHSIAVMVQREAAERIMSEPGAKQWCAMAAQLQYYGRAVSLCEVGPEAFDPPPHVSSRFIRIDRHRNPTVAPRDERLFRRLIQAAFAMRRKTLANNLKAAFGLDQGQALAVLEAAGVDARVRGEALSLQQLCCVADALSEVQRG